MENRQKNKKGKMRKMKRGDGSTIRRGSGQDTEGRLEFNGRQPAKAIQDIPRSTVGVVFPTRNKSRSESLEAR